MASRRGAVKVNPVTGKMEKVESVKGPDGTTVHRDGCMAVDQKYINAAKELGLGSDEGMYSHIKSLVRVGAGDIHTGTSMEKEGASRGSGEKAGVDVRDTAAVAKAIATAVTTSKQSVQGAGQKAQVHGFSGGGAGKPSMHNHEDSFQRRKGVVNTIGGAKDTTRAAKEEPRLPPKGERKGAQIMGFSTLDAHTAEGKARREAAAKRESAGNGYKPTMVHVSGGGGRNISGGLGGSSSSGSGKPPAAAHRPVLAAASSSSSSAAAAAPRRETTINTLGGSSDENDGMTDAERRAAFFEKRFAEAQAAKKAAAAAVGM